MLFVDSLGQYNDYMVVVSAGGAGVSIKGLLDTDDLSLGLSANVGAGTIAGMMEGGIKGVGKALAGRVGGDIGRNLVSENFKTVLSTYLGYEDSSNPSISISMHIFPGKNGAGSISSITNQIAKLTQPDTANDGLIKSYLYNVEMVKDLAKGIDPFKGGLIHVQIGSWFTATGLFCTSSDISISKFVDTSGKPISLTWSATFVPYKILNADELSAWFSK